MSSNNDIPFIFSEVINVRCMAGLNTPHQLLDALKTSSQEKRVSVFYSATKTPIAYVAWANVNKESFLMSSKTKQMPPYLYEWGEGHLMLVYDYACAPQWGRIAKKALREFLLKKHFVSFIKNGRLHAWSRSQGRLKRDLF